MGSQNGELPAFLTVGEWHATRATGELSGVQGDERLEPKVMDLLFVLASRPGDAFLRDELMETLWPGVIVGDDTLARTVSRLRKALGDDSKQPRYIETLPKRGYRLVAAVSAGSSTQSGPAAPIPAPFKQARLKLNWPAIAFAAAIAVTAIFAFSETPEPPLSDNMLAERANDFYFQFKRADNEAAITLYERLLTNDPENTEALAGLANALVQKVIRWPNEQGSVEYTKLGDALKSGRTKFPASKTLLARARVLADRAVALAPNDAGTLKARGFVASAEGRFKQALADYRKSIQIEPDAWGSLINIGDVLEITGEPDKALPYFEQAHAAMTRIYDRQSARVRPWYAELGVAIAQRYRTTHRLDKAELWLRKVLAHAPLNAPATGLLAQILRDQGQDAAATELCENLRKRIGAASTCP